MATSTRLTKQHQASHIAAAADDLMGQASIIDGDTLEIHGNRIRLRGIDAPGKQSAMPGG
jgi:endonuclease YncB( thermonuclease family)